jgi:uncharacterized protein
MYSAIQKQQMLTTAQEAIEHGLTLGTRLKPDHKPYHPELLAPAATFITLKIDGLLRGCIGSVHKREPLIDNIAYNAHSAAFNDPRFGPVDIDELTLLSIEISILSDCESLIFSSEQELIQQLRPGIDGLLIKEGEYSGTFLPTVWQQLNNAEDFTRELKIKAGLSQDYWSDSLSAERYHVHSFSN